MSEKPNSRVRSHYSGDPDMAELVQLFVAELPKRLEAMESALRGGEVESLFRLAHQMKGAAGGYGFPSISVAAGKLEAMVKCAGAPDVALSAAAESLRELVELCERAVAN